MTRWNRSGIRWRDLGLAELSWLLYVDFVESLSDDPQALRELLMVAGDKASVAALDRKVMGQERTIVTDR